MKKALYRAFRPRTFGELVGQDKIVQALKNQIMTGRPAHAYLFAGTRGTGKTSCAKIFARAVNCTDLKEGNPCNECPSCRAILDEQTMDVVEMDAASNRRIDDIRELRETVIYPPTGLRYKVYIIDEAHMITKEGFNALLKIMEEPPDHLIFILATTEADKIPQTILSRLQRFEFKRLDPDIIEKRLKEVCQKIGAHADDAALRSLALAADGAMRDGLSLLDQALAYKNSLSLEDVEEMLGTVGISDLDRLSDYVLHDELSQSFLYAEGLFKEGREIGRIMLEWMDYFRNLLLLKGGGPEIKLDISDRQRRTMEKIIEDVDLQRILDSVSILIDTEKLIKKSDFSQALFLSCLARLANPVSEDDLKSRLKALERKASLLESWQSPEKLVREEVSKQLKNFDLSKLNKSIGPIEGPEKKKTQEVAQEVPDAVKERTFDEVDQGEQELSKQTVKEPDKLREIKVDKVDKSPDENIKKGKIKSHESDDMLSLFKEKEGAFRQEITERKILPSAMLGHYKSLDASGANLKVIYGQDSFVYGLIKNKEKEIQEVLTYIMDKPCKLILSKGDPDKADDDSKADYESKSGYANKVDYTKKAEHESKADSPPTSPAEEKKGRFEDDNYSIADSRQTRVADKTDERPDAAHDPILEKLQKMIPKDILEVE